MTRRTFHRSLLGAAASPALIRASERRAIAEFDSATNGFILGNGRFEKRLGLTVAGTLELRQFGLRGGRNWASPGSRWSTGFHTRTVVRESGGPADVATVFGLSDPSRVRFLRHEVEGDPGAAMELRLYFEEPERKLDYVLHLRSFADHAVIEQWLEVRNRGNETLRGLDRFDPLLLPVALGASEPCTLYYLQGERWVLNHGGENIQPYGPYHVCRLGLLAGNGFLLSSRQDSPYRRLPTSTAEYVNWFSLELGPASEGIFGGIQWSGYWLLHFARTSSELIVQGGVDNCRHDLAPGASICSPRVFVGCYRGGVDAGIHEMQRYLRAQVIPAAPDANFPWTCYNTWNGWNIGLREKALKEEAKLAADLGIECFYIDAGWYAGSPETGSFSRGLGTWRENREKFPSGIAAFADAIHALGMKFGLWVEPERVHMSLVDQPGSPIRKAWLAAEGAPGSGPAGTDVLCFGNPEVRSWAKESLSRVISEYKVDWLKWDHNFYYVCTRADHGHQAGDGNFAHINGVYEVMGHLRRQFPRLVIENCSGGGHRTDFGIIRYTDTAWTSDATSPAHRVRYQNVGAGHVFPARYLNSWFVKTDEEPVSPETPAALLDYYLRSRMIGAFGISVRLGEWPANMREAARRGIALYKERIRPALAGEVHHLLPQASLFIPPLKAPEEWEAVEYFEPAGQRGVILCFRAAAGAATCVLPVRGLDARARYRLTWHDAGRSRTRSGAEWAKAGLEVTLPEKFTSEVIWIERA